MSILGLLPRSEAGRTIAAELRNCQTLIGKLLSKLEEFWRGRNRGGSSLSSCSDRAVIRTGSTWQEKLKLAEVSLKELPYEALNLQRSHVLSH